MFVSVNKRPYISCANDVEMCVLEEKKIIFGNRVTESYSRPNKVKWRKYNQSVVLL